MEALKSEFLIEKPNLSKNDLKGINANFYFDMLDKKYYETEVEAKKEMQTNGTY
jgi:hypothetical protein